MKTLTLKITLPLLASFLLSTIFLYSTALAYSSADQKGPEDFPDQATYNIIYNAGIKAAEKPCKDDPDHAECVNAIEEEYKYHAWSKCQSDDNSLSEQKTCYRKFARDNKTISQARKASGLGRIKGLTTYESPDTPGGGDDDVGGGSTDDAVSTWQGGEVGVSTLNPGNINVSGSATGINNEDSDKLVARTLNGVYTIVAIIAVIVIVAAGIMYITSDGDANRIATARKAIIYALVGLVIVGSAFIITGIIQGIGTS